MLHIIVKPVHDAQEPTCLHVGMGDRIVMATTVIAERVVAVLADGAELDHILENFTGLPTAKAGQGLDPISEMSWLGDHAKFIVSNWK